MQCFFALGCYSYIVPNGIILNRWNGDFMQRDNLAMIEELTGVKVIAVVRDNDAVLDIDEKTLVGLYKDLG